MPSKKRCSFSIYTTTVLSVPLFAYRNLKLPILFLIRKKTIELAREAASRKAILAIFPELGLSAYSNEDLFIRMRFYIVSGSNCQNKKASERSINYV